MSGTVMQNVPLFQAVTPLPADTDSDAVFFVFKGHCDSILLCYVGKSPILLCNLYATSFYCNIMCISVHNNGAWRQQKIGAHLKSGGR